MQTADHRFLKTLKALVAFSPKNRRETRKPILEKKFKLKLKNEKHRRQK